MAEHIRKPKVRHPGLRQNALGLTRRDYDTICPMWIRPRPTEIARVGLVLTEFDRPAKGVGK